MAVVEIVPLVAGAAPFVVRGRIANDLCLGLQVQGAIFAAQTSTFHLLAGTPLPSTYLQARPCRQRGVAGVAHGFGAAASEVQAC